MHSARIENLETYFSLFFFKILNLQLSFVQEGIHTQTFVALHNILSHGKSVPKLQC